MLAVAHLQNPEQRPGDSPIRHSEGARRGDNLLFELSADQMVRLRAVKCRKLSDFRGKLRAQRSFTGKEAVREEVGQSWAARQVCPQAIVWGPTHVNGRRRATACRW